MVSDVRGGFCAAAGTVLERIVIHELGDAQRVSGEVGESAGATGTAPVRPAPRMARANASAALTSANASDALRIVSAERRGAAER
jgi:hypothetical protein